MFGDEFIDDIFEEGDIFGRGEVEFAAVFGAMVAEVEFE